MVIKLNEDNKKIKDITSIKALDDPTQLFLSFAFQKIKDFKDNYNNKYSNEEILPFFIRQEVLMSCIASTVSTCAIRNSITTKHK